MLKITIRKAPHQTIFFILLLLSHPQAQYIRQHIFLEHIQLIIFPQIVKWNFTQNNFHKLTVRQVWLHFHVFKKCMCLFDGLHKRSSKTTLENVLLEASASQGLKIPLYTHLRIRMCMCIYICIYICIHFHTVAYSQCYHAQLYRVYSNSGLQRVLLRNFALGG